MLLMQNSNSSFKTAFKFWRQGVHSSVARRFVLATVLSSTLIAIFITSFQLYISFQNDLSELHSSIEDIEKSRLPSIVDSMWSIDTTLIESQLQGILKLKGIEYVGIITDEESIEFKTSNEIINQTTYNYPLIKKEDDQTFFLGDLILLVSIDHLYEKIITQGLIILFTNTFKTLLVAFIIIIIYQVMIGQHLTNISIMITNNKDNQKADKINLNIDNSKNNELVILQNSINSWIEKNKQYNNEQEQLNQQITQQRDTLEAINKKLNIANEDLTQFAYSASHDLKAPLTSITGFLHFVSKDIDKGDIKRASFGVSKAKKEAEHLSLRIEDMLELARSDMAINHWEPINIDNEINEIWSSLQNAYFNTPCSIKVIHNSTQPVILVKSRFQTIIENILSNSIKYAHPDRLPVKVTLEINHSENNIAISIKDNGIGIPEKFHNRVFTVFQRFSNSDTPGSGLGLAIVKKNIEKLNGEITFISSDQGTEFTIIIPKIKQPELLNSLSTTEQDSI